MKAIKILSFTIIAAVVFMSCSKDDIKDSNEFPHQIEIYVKTHFPDNKIINIDRIIYRSSRIYDVKLGWDIELLFSSNMEIIKIEGTTKLPNSVFPKKS